MRIALAALALAVLGGCTSVNTARLPQGEGRDGVFVTTGDLKEPYTSVGMVQATRRAVVWFGFWDPAGTDLDDAMADLLPQIRSMGGDGLINLRFEQTQYPPLARACGLLFFFAPLPTEVTLRGEVVKLGAPAAPSGEPARPGTPGGLR